MRSLVAPFVSREFLTHWALAFASGVGALSGLIALLPKVELDAFRSVLMLISCSLLAAIYARRKVHSIHLPVDELAPLSLSAGQSMAIETSCDRSLVAQVNKLAKEVYGPTVGPIPLERYEQWLLVNCTILACLVDQTRRVVGYFDVFPLREDFLDFFVKGEVGELDIRHEHILNRELARKCSRLYLAGFAVASPGTPTGGRHALYLLWALWRYLQFFYEPLNGRQLFAAAATPEGERILQRYNFQLVQPGHLRRDGSSVYVAVIGDRLIKAMSALPDWSGVCRLSWEQSTSASSRTA